MIKLCTDCTRPGEEMTDTLTKIINRIAEAHGTPLAVGTSQAIIKRAKERMIDEPDIAIAMLRYLPEIEQAGLLDLIAVLDGGEYGCHTNDVKGVIDILERHMRE